MDIRSECVPNEVVASICAFVGDALSQIEDVSSFTSWIQKKEVVKAFDVALSKLPLKPSTLSSRSLNLLDSSGTALWNAFNRLLQHIDDEVKTTTPLVQVPLLAYHMLRNCVLRDEDTLSGNSKYLKVLIKCADICLAADMNEQASNILYQAASTVDTLESDGIFDTEILISVARYHMIRALMALKDEDLESADTMLSRVSEDAIRTNSAVGEQYADLCHTALRMTIKCNLTDSAEAWLRRISNAFKIFHEYSSLYANYRKIHLEVLQTLATANLSGVSEALDSLAIGLCQTAEQDHRREFPVLVLQLEFMSKQEQFDLPAFYEALMEHIGLMEPTIANFKRSLKYICKLRSLGSDLALKPLEYLFQGIGAFPLDETWLEQTFVVLLRLLTSAMWAPLNCLKPLEDMANALSKILPRSLSNAASDASLIILWKQIEALSLQDDFLQAQAWCRFGQHHLFLHASIVNQAIILRKEIFCAFQVGDFMKAELAWMSLSEEEKDLETTYLMCQVFLKNSDTSSAADLLKWLADLGTLGQHYASAAIAAAVRSQLGQQTLESINMFIEGDLTTCGNEQFILNLHRITIQIIILEIREMSGNVEALFDQICRHFSKATDLIHHRSSDPNDLDWFSRCSYLIALELFKEAGEQQVLSLLGFSIKLMGMYPQDIGSDVKLDLIQRRLGCHYLQVLIHTMTARKETDSAKKKSSYSEVASHCHEVQTIMASQHTGDNTCEEGLLCAGRYRQLLAFKLEATVYLQQQGQK